MQEMIGPYRVEEQLGVGGMGEVYKAYDDRLQRWVAIKRIRTDRDEDEENRERFQREARATARLNHSSIVHVYDIFREKEGDSDCIVMEYIEGRTLDRLIRNGPLEPAQVAVLGHEIANGLAEAHDKGIIHRDLKVENVIVTSEGRAKILDFGLARPLLKKELDTSLTGKGQLVGTSRAMSPEYVSGEEIDHRSDLFSLGVLLYEAVTSHSPFKAHNTLSTLKQVMLHRQTPAHQVNSNVPEDLSAVIERLLKKDPADRPQSAQEVAQELGRISGRLSSGDVDRPSLSTTFSTTPTEIFAPTTSIDLWSLRRWLLTIAVILVAGIATTYSLTRWWLSGPELVPIQGMAGNDSPTERDRIVLADFQNHTGDPMLDDSLALAFRLGLEQSRFTTVLPESRVQDVLSRMQRVSDTTIDRQLGIEICQREGAKALVIGAIGKIGDTYSLSAEIVDPQTGVSTFATNSNAENQNAVVTALEVVTKAIRLNLGESLAAIEETQRPLEKVTTSDLGALKAYSLGVARAFEGESEAAIQLFQRALEIDPDFAMAHAKLASLYMRGSRDREKALEHLDQALRLSDRLTRIEKLYVEGWIARLQGNPADVLRIWSLTSTLYPADYNGQYNLGMAQLLYFGQFEEAGLAFEAAARVATSENLSATLIQRGYCHLALEEVDQALAMFEKASGDYGQMALADLYLVTKNYGEAGRVLEEIVAGSVPYYQILARQTVARLHADRGEFEQARDQAFEAQRLAKDVNLEQLRLASQVAIALAHQNLGNLIEFNAALSASNDIARSLMRLEYERGDPAPLQIVASVGKLNVRNGRVEYAEEVHSWIVDLVSKTPLPVWKSLEEMLAGEILSAQGRGEEALAQLISAGGHAGSFQLHESLARVYEMQERLADAVAEYEWIRGHRGMGFVECLDPCTTQSAIDWSMAEYHLGRMHEKQGHLAKAAESYRRYLDHWQEAVEVEAWQAAKIRLESLEKPGSVPD